MHLPWLDVELFSPSWLSYCPYHCIKQNNNIRLVHSEQLDRLGKTHPTHYTPDTLCLHNTQRHTLYTRHTLSISWKYWMSQILRNIIFKSLLQAIYLNGNFSVCCLNLTGELLWISCGKFICGQWLLDIIIPEETTSLEFTLEKGRFPLVKQ